VAENFEEARAKAEKFYGKTEISLIQDPDVLDTWFSSGMWPFVTLGWPENTADLKRFYSKMIVVTGFDIIFFWVARMIMMGVYSLKEVPFPDVYIHGLVRDEKGRKMSKSKGNVINPLDLCKKYGTDAVRYTLASLSSPGRDIKMSEQLVEIGRNFLTKLWNTVRFAQMNDCVYNLEFRIENVSHPVAKWIIHQVKQMVSQVENSLENYRFDEAVSHLYHCVWNSFCDWYMEFIKPILQQSSSDINGKKDVGDTTAWAILQFMGVLYPISPFIAKKLTEEIGATDVSWPNFSAASLDFNAAVEEVEFLKTVISSVRSLKQYLHFSPGDKVNIRVESDNSKIHDLVSKYSEVLHRMAGVGCGKISGQTIPVVISNAIIHVDLGDKIDLVDEKAKLRAEVSNLRKNRESVLLRLSNNNFLKKADEEVIREHKKRMNDIDEKIQKIDHILQSLEAV
jgi:valyl-tRNA synthetase